jgi:hypothetical protein
MKRSSALSPILPRNYLPNSQDAEVGYRYVEEAENLLYIGENNPDKAIKTNQTVGNVDARNSLPASILPLSGSNSSLKSNISSRMSHTEDETLHRSALSPRSESLSGNLSEKHQTIPSKTLNLTLSPHSEPSRWRVGSAPPRPSSTSKGFNFIAQDKNIVLCHS